MSCHDQQGIGVNEMILQKSGNNRRSDTDQVSMESI